jgi:chemotaxis protein CheD
LTAAAHTHRITVIQGEWVVSHDADTVLTTILGSCVAACLRDPVAGIGGMNHFLLPDSRDSARVGDAERYGVHLMELLLNGLLKDGARRDRLEAKLFGGCSFMTGRYAIGERNVEFAERFLKAEGIRTGSGSTGGNKGRRIEFWPVSGRARQIFLRHAPVEEPRRPKKPPHAGEIELF